MLSRLHAVAVEMNVVVLWLQETRKMGMAIVLPLSLLSFLLFNHLYKSFGPLAGGGVDVSK